MIDSQLKIAAKVVTCFDIDILNKKEPPQLRWLLFFSLSRSFYIETDFSYIPKP